MKYRYLFILVIICFQVNTAQSQGLAGKPFSVFYTYNYSFKSENLRYNDAIERGANYSTYVVGQHGLQINYAFNRIWEVGASTSFFRDGYGVHREFGRLYSKNIKANGFGAHLRRYNLKKGSIAPVGKYVEVATQLLDVNPSFDENPDNLNLFGYPLPYQIPSLKMWAITIGGGKSVILFKDVILSFGYEVGLVLPLNDDGSSLPLSSLVFTEYYNTPIERMNLFYKARVKMCLGLAAF